MFTDQKTVRRSCIIFLRLDSLFYLSLQSSVRLSFYLCLWTNGGTWGFTNTLDSVSPFWLHPNFCLGLLSSFLPWFSFSESSLLPDSSLSLRVPVRGLVSFCVLISSHCDWCIAQAWVCLSACASVYEYVVGSWWRSTQRAGTQRWRSARWRWHCLSGTACSASCDWNHRTWWRVPSQCFSTCTCMALLLCPRPSL